MEVNIDRPEDPVLASKQQPADCIYPAGASHRLEVPISVLGRLIKREKQTPQIQKL